jgi:hypothetical protein
LSNFPKHGGIAPAERYHKFIFIVLNPTLSRQLMHGILKKKPYIQLKKRQIPIFKNFDLIRPGLKPTIDRIRREHAKHYANDDV